MTFVGGMSWGFGLSAQDMSSQLAVPAITLQAAMLSCQDGDELSYPSRTEVPHPINCFGHGLFIAAMEK